MKKLSLVVLSVLLLTGCLPDEQESSVTDVSEKIIELQKQLEELKTENGKLAEQKEEEIINESDEAMPLPKTELASSTTCNNGYTLSLDKTSCVKIPTNAHAVESQSDVWLCNEGFVEVGTSCVKPTQKPQNIASNASPGINKEILELERQRLEIEKERMALEKEKNQLKVEPDEKSDDYHMIELNLVGCSKDSKNESPFTSEYDHSAFVACDFQIIFTHPEKVYSLNLKEGRWKYQEYQYHSGFCKENYVSGGMLPQGSSEETIFAGKDGEVKNPTIWFSVDPFCYENSIVFPVRKAGEIVDYITVKGVKIPPYTYR